MKRRSIASVVQIVSLVLLLVPLPSLAGGAVKTVGVSFALPEDSEPILLTGRLTYGAFGGVVEVTSVRLEILSEEGEDPVRARWTLTGSNEKNQARRAELRIFLIKGKDRRIASAGKKVVFKSADEEQEFVLEMEVKEKKWAAAERVHVQVTFFGR
jgi:hypothetical protein